MNRSWNPLVCDGFSLRPHLLLMAKLIVIYLIARSEHLHLSDGFLPFWNLGGAWGPSPLFRFCLQVLFWISSLCLLFNRRPRLSSAVLGLVLLISVLTSRVLYQNNRVFFGCLLFLTGLQNKDRDVYLLRWQVVLVYLGAGLNKILDPDWQSGQYMRHWLTEVLQLDFYDSLAGWVGSTVFFQGMSWVTIAMEFFLAGIFLFPAAYPAGIAAGFLFHGLMIPLSGWTVSYLFFYAMMCSYLAFLDWRDKPAQNTLPYFFLAGLFILFQKNVHDLLALF